jgi:hypothetical protein
MQVAGRTWGFFAALKNDSGRGDCHGFHPRNDWREGKLNDGWWVYEPTLRVIRCKIGSGDSSLRSIMTAGGEIASALRASQGQRGTQEWQKKDLQ